MSKRPRVRVALVGLLFAVGTAGCDIDFDEFVEFVNLSAIPDADVRAAEEVRLKADKLKQANTARDKYLASGQVADLREALRLNPDDPELAAYRYDVAPFATETDRERADAELLAAVAKAQKAKGEPTDPRSVGREASREILRARARQLAGATSGVITEPVPPDKREQYESYCRKVASHKAIYGDDAFQFTVDLEHGDVCARFSSTR